MIEIATYVLFILLKSSHHGTEMIFYSLMLLVLGSNEQSLHNKNMQTLFTEDLFLDMLCLISEKILCIDDR